MYPPPNSTVQALMQCAGMWGEACVLMPLGLGLSIHKASHWRHSGFRATHQVCVGPACSVLIPFEAFGPTCLTHGPPSLGCWTLSRALWGSHYLGRTDSLYFSLSASSFFPFFSRLNISALVGWECFYVSFKSIWLLLCTPIPTPTLFLFPPLKPLSSLWGLYFCKSKRWKNTFAFCSSFLEVIYRKLEWRKGKSIQKKTLISKHDPHIPNECSLSLLPIRVSLRCGFQINCGLWN